VPDADDLQRTSLHALHLEQGGRMVPFAGYEMPVRYGPGPLAEHTQCRTAAALFDVSHMGIVELRGPGVAPALERLVPSSVGGLGVGRMRYSVLTTEDGGVIDDVMIANDGDDHLTLVVNAGGKAADVAHLRAGLPPAVSVRHRADLALLALQGPAAAAVVARHDPAAAELVFMQTGPAIVAGVPVGISRSGYTGEDGFEITVPVERAPEVARALLAEPEVAFAGLAARDSLRLEAGLCLYGHDLDLTTTPIEAGLAWVIQARRREEGGFPGASSILGQLRDGPERRRVGLRPEGRKPVRDGATLRTAPDDGRPLGAVTSGGYGPTAGGPIAMGYVAVEAAEPGTSLVADERGTPVPCRVVELPFVPHRYFRGA
jgi:glycine cleavage system T protein (aminomethyltransferase)